MKRLVIEIDETLHKAIRSAAFKQEKTMKQFVTDVLEREVKEKKSEQKADNAECVLKWKIT